MKLEFFFDQTYVYYKKISKRKNNALDVYCVFI